MQSENTLISKGKRLTAAALGLILFTLSASYLVYFRIYIGLTMPGDLAGMSQSSHAASRFFFLSMQAAISVLLAKMATLLFFSQVRSALPASFKHTTLKLRRALIATKKICNYLYFRDNFLTAVAAIIIFFLTRYEFSTGLLSLIFISLLVYIVAVLTLVASFRIRLNEAREAFFQLGRSKTPKSIEKSSLNRKLLALFAFSSIITGSTAGVVAILDANKVLTSDKMIVTTLKNQKVYKGIITAYLEPGILLVTETSAYPSFVPKLKSSKAGVFIPYSNVSSIENISNAH